MLETMLRYLALMRHRRTFVAGLLAVFALASVCQVVAHTTLIWGSGNQSARELASGFGDAFIVAVVVAMLADPVIQHRFATEWGRDLYWAIFSPNAPPEFRNALQGLAAPPAYIESCSWEFEFKYPDSGKEFFEVDFGIWITGVALDRRGFRIADRLFLVPRHDGTPSSYTLWSFQSDSSDRVAYRETKLKSLGAITVDNSSRTVLDQSLLGVDSVGFAHKYHAERHVSTSRWIADYFPLFQARIVLRQTIVIRGEPVSKLDFSVTQLGGTQAEPIKTHEDGDAVPELHFKIDHVTFPGQASLLVWKPKVEPTPAVGE